MLRYLPPQAESAKQQHNTEQVSKNLTSSTLVTPATSSQPKDAKPTRARRRRREKAPPVGKRRRRQDKRHERLTLKISIEFIIEQETVEHRLSLWSLTTNSIFSNNSARSSLDLSRVTTTSRHGFSIVGVSLSRFRVGRGLIFSRVVERGEIVS